MTPHDAHSNAAQNQSTAITADFTDIYSYVYKSCYIAKLI